MMRGTIEQTWEERIACLQQRAEAVGLTRVGDNCYCKGSQMHFVEERYPHELLPGERASEEPHFHGRRYMTSEELARMARKRAFE